MPVHPIHPYTRRYGRGHASRRRRNLPDPLALAPASFPGPHHPRHRLGPHRPRRPADPPAYVRGRRGGRTGVRGARRDRQGAGAGVRGRGAERGRGRARHDGPRPGARHRRDRRHRPVRRGRLPAPADEGPAPPGLVRTGEPGDPPGDRGRCHRGRHPRQEPPRLRVVRPPCAVPRTADGGRRDPHGRPRHPALRRHGRWHGPDRLHPHRDRTAPPRRDVLDVRHHRNAPATSTTSSPASPPPAATTATPSPGSTCSSGARRRAARY